MKKYEKMLLAIHEPELNCFSNKGDWLYIADKRDTKKGFFRLANYHYYFVSIKEGRTPSQFGVVKKIEQPITALELAELDFASRKRDITLITEIEMQQYEKFLEAVNKLPEHTPMAVTWLEKIFPKKSKELKVHKAFFSCTTKEERDEIFGD